MDGWQDGDLLRLLIAVVVVANAYVLGKVYRITRVRIEDECERVRRETEAKVIAEICGRVVDINREESLPQMVDKPLPRVLPFPSKGEHAEEV